MKNKKQRGQIAGLIIALILVLIGGVVFMGAVSGWFSGPKVVIDSEYYCEGENCAENFVDLTIEEFNNLANVKKSFVIFVDKDGCTTADRMRGFITDVMNKKGIKIFRMDWEDMKETSVHELVKYYPSVVIISKGKVFKFLRADSDEDVGAYENGEDFKKWLEQYIG